MGLWSLRTIADLSLCATRTECSVLVAHKATSNVLVCHKDISILALWHTRPSLSRLPGLGVAFPNEFAAWIPECAECPSEYAAWLPECRRPTFRKFRGLFRNRFRDHPVTRVLPTVCRPPGRCAPRHPAPGACSGWVDVPLVSLWRHQRDIHAEFPRAVSALKALNNPLR